MAFTALITLTTAGVDTGPFNLYSNIDGYTVAFESSVPKASLEAGYLSTLVPDSTTTIRVQSMSVLCSNYVDLPITGITTTTTTTTTTSTTTTTTTTLAPPILFVINNNTEGGSSIVNVTVPTATVTPVSGAFPLALGEDYTANVSVGTYTVNVEITATTGNVSVTGSTEGCINVTGAGTYTFNNVSFSLGNTVTVNFSDGSCV